MSISNATRELVQAIFDNDPHRVSTCLARGADVNARGEFWQTPLFLAAPESKDRAIAEQLLARGADVRARDEHDATPLHVAAAVGDEARIALFLDRGAEIDARCVDGWTPLHCTAFVGRVEEASFLVSRGADVSIRDTNGETPLHVALVNVEKHLREPFKRLLGGFMTAEVVEARPDALILRVETIHSKYTEAERLAKQCGTLIVPCGIFSERPRLGDVLRCQKGLSPGLDEAWTEARRKAELGIERER
jgi:Ankyrin repeats (3 copies)/Ankyrin repeat